MLAKHLDFLRRLFGGSVRRQLIVGVALVHLALMTVFVFDLVHRQRNFLHQQTEAQAQSLARTLAVNSISWALANDLAGLEETVAGLKQYPDLRYAWVMDAGGRVLAHTEPGMAGLYARDAASQRLRVADPGRGHLLISRPDLIDAAVPILANERLIGWARVGLSQEKTTAQLGAVRLEGILYTLFAIAIGSLLAIIIGRRLTRGLTALAEVAEATRAGQRGLRAPILHRDEVGRASANFNAMLETLERDEARLSETRAALAASEERFDLALKGANDGLWDWDLHTNKVFFSTRWKTMLGHTEDEVGDGLDEWKKRVHPDDLAGTMRDVQAHLDGTTPLYENLHRVRHKDGHYLWILNRGLAVRDATGKPYRMVGTHTDVSRRMALEDELNQYKRALDVHSIVSMTDAAGAITYANDKFCEVSGYRREELLGQNHRILKSGMHAPEFYGDMWTSIAAGKPWQGEICNRRKDGRLYWVLSTIVPFLDANGLPYRYLSFRTVVTEIKLAQRALAAERDRAQVTLACIGDGVVVTDAHGHVTYLNPEAERLTGWKLEEAEGVSAAEVALLLDEATGQPAVEHPVARCRLERTVVGHDTPAMLLTPDGRRVPVEHSAAPILDASGKLGGVVMVLHDVSRARELTRRMSWQLTHDGLTGLVSRGEFERRLQGLIDSTHETQEAHGTRAAHALLYLDLDQFKIVNDTCGHAAGDELLKQLAFLLQKEMRHADTLARLGGDEFGVLLASCPQHKAREIAERLRATARDFRFTWEGQAFEIGVSIGMVMLDAHIGNLADALRHADAACYAAKDHGRNRVHVFEADDAEMARRHGEIQWATRLNEALAQDRFRLVAQEIRPLSSASEGRHFEVLLRMLDTDGTEIPPGAFIPAAERYNLMGRIDRWVIAHALRMLREHGLENGGARLAINLSGLSLTDDTLPAYLRGQLHVHRVLPGSLCFEVTETAAISHLATAVRFIEEMRTLGCRFALDDFGSGMSSFAYLKNLPVDFLKIDGAFVRDIETDPIDHAFVETIQRIGQAMGKQTIAEFVENETILRMLDDLGVNFAQGYGVSRPRPLEDWLAELAGAAPETRAAQGH